MGKCTKLRINIDLKYNHNKSRLINLIMTNRDFNPLLHNVPSRVKYLKCIQQWTNYHLPPPTPNIKWAAFPPRQWYSVDLCVLFNILLMSITFLNNIIISYAYSQQKKIKWPMHFSFRPFCRHHFIRDALLCSSHSLTFSLQKLKMHFFLYNHCISSLRLTIKETRRTLFYFTFVPFSNAHSHTQVLSFFLCVFFFHSV